jgi:hypothetical protein
MKRRVVKRRTKRARATTVNVFNLSEGKHRDCALLALGAAALRSQGSVQEAVEGVGPLRAVTADT